MSKAQSLGTLAEQTAQSVCKASIITSVLLPLSVRRIIRWLHTFVLERTDELKKIPCRQARKNWRIGQNFAKELPQILVPQLSKMAKKASPASRCKPWSVFVQ